MLTTYRLLENSIEFMFRLMFLFSLKSIPFKFIYTISLVQFSLFHINHGITVFTL